MLKSIFAATAALALLAAGTAFAAEPASATPPALKDGMFVTASGMTLYTFDKDATPGKSVCNGPCANNWPPLMAAETAQASGDFTVLARDDGKKQWAFKGKPLYFWAKDDKPGDRTGDGFNKVWQAARP